MGRDPPTHDGAFPLMPPQHTPPSSPCRQTPGLRRLPNLGSVGCAVSARAARRGRTGSMVSGVRRSVPRTHARPSECLSASSPYSPHPGHPFGRPRAPAPTPTFLPLLVRWFLGSLSPCRAPSLRPASLLCLSLPLCPYLLSPLSPSLRVRLCVLRPAGPRPAPPCPPARFAAVSWRTDNLAEAAAAPPPSRTAARAGRGCGAPRLRLWGRGDLAGSGRGTRGWGESRGAGSTRELE